MTKEQIKEYTARVAQANRTELVVIIYEPVSYTHLTLPTT